MAPFARTTLPAHYKGDQTFGRPTAYRPEYGDMLIEVTMREGISLAAFAGLIGVSKDTVYEWIKRHADFSDAVSRARPARLLFLERKLLRSRKGAETSAAMFGLKNADPEEWRDVKHTEHAHTLKVEQLTDAQLYAIASQKSRGNGTVIEGEAVDMTQ
jgi:hypothetical protein